MAHDMIPSLHNISSGSTLGDSIFGVIWGGNADWRLLHPPSNVHEPDFLDGFGKRRGDVGSG